MFSVQIFPFTECEPSVNESYFLPAPGASALLLNFSESVDLLNPARQEAQVTWLKRLVRLLTRVRVASPGCSEVDWTPRILGSARLRK
jgi:hypothetical protein